MAAHDGPRRVRWLIPLAQHLLTDFGNVDAVLIHEVKRSDDALVICIEAVLYSERLYRFAAVILFWRRAGSVCKRLETAEKAGRGEWIRTTDLLVPNQAL